MTDENSASPVLDLFRESRTALLLGDDEALPAAELAVLAHASGQWLLSKGLARGDRVALWMKNGRGYVQAFLACASAGVVAVSINTRYSTPEVQRLLERAGVRGVITDQPWTSDDQSILTIRSDLLLRLGAGETKFLSNERVSFGQASIGETPESLANDRCVVFTTSGSTGEPKMVVHSQASVANHALDIASHAGFSPDDVALVAMPLCGTFGLTSLLGVVAAGCSTVVVPASFDAEDTGSLIEEHGVSLINGSDDMFHRLLTTRADLSSIRVGGYARFNTSLDGIVERADERGMLLTGLYGMSEVQALFSIRDMDEEALNRSQAGGTLTSPLAHYRIIDGELQLRGPGLFEGYLAEGGAEIDQTLTESAMDSNWFRTGDSAERRELDDDRSFTFVSRLGDVLRLGGFLVAPTEIEQVIMSFGCDQGNTGDGPAGAVMVGAQVVAIDRPSGARPVAFVVLSPGSAELDEEAVKEHCSQELARFKVPIRIHVVDEFPTVVGPNGVKILRSELRSLAERLAIDSV